MAFSGDVYVHRRITQLLAILRPLLYLPFILFCLDFVLSKFVKYVIYIIYMTFIYRLTESAYALYLSLMGDDISR